EGEGASVTCCASVKEALQAITANGSRPDVLISDIGMPDEDGYSLIRKIRSGENGHRLPAIALTAYAKAEDGTRLLAAGFDRHVAKPFEREDLVAQIETLLKPQ